MQEHVVSDEQLLQGLRQHPRLRERVSALLSIAGACGESLRLADDAEAAVIEEVRRMGQDTLQAWAETQVLRTEDELRRNGHAHSNGKKNSTGTAPLVSCA